MNGNLAAVLGKILEVHAIEQRSAKGGKALRIRTWTACLRQQIGASPNLWNPFPSTSRSSSTAIPAAIRTPRAHRSNATTTRERLASRTSRAAIPTDHPRRLRAGLTGRHCHYRRPGCHVDTCIPRSTLQIAANASWTRKENFAAQTRGIETPANHHRPLEYLPDTPFRGGYIFANKKLVIIISLGNVEIYSMRYTYIFITRVNYYSLYNNLWNIIK